MDRLWNQYLDILGAFNLLTEMQPTITSCSCSITKFQSFSWKSSIKENEHHHFDKSLCIWYLYIHNKTKGSWNAFLGFGWPSGAPRCNIRPGHGSQVSTPVNATLSNLGEGNWSLTINESFQGIIVNVDKQGRDCLALFA